MAATRFVVLLRSVNVGGRALGMAPLREALAAAGFGEVATHIQSGNLVLATDLGAAETEAAIERLIADRFGLDVPSIAREAAAFAALAAANPFPAADPKRLHLALAKRPIAPDAPARLAAKGTMDEQVALADGGLWIDYRGGVGRSKLTPALLDRAAGSPATARNGNTVARLVEMAGAS